MASPNQAAWNKLKEERKNLLPTPPVGANVQWVERANGAQPRAALVVEVEGPGRVCVVLSVPHSMPVTKRGVYFNDHPDARRAARNGTYRYLPGREAPVEDFVVHEDHLKIREAALKRADEEHALAEKKRQEELKSAAETAAA